MPVGKIYGQIGLQSGMLAYIDIFKVLSILAFSGIFFSLFLKRIEPGEKSEGGH